MCSLAVAAGQGPNGLVRDLITLVSTAEQQIWQIDHYEYADLMNDALVLVCVADEKTREEASRLLLSFQDKLGGDPRKIWSKENQHDARIQELLTVSRSKTLLAKALKVSNERCPFVLVQSSVYIERHRMTDRLFMAFQGGGGSV